MPNRNNYYVVGTHSDGTCWVLADCESTKDAERHIAGQRRLTDHGRPLTPVHWTIRTFDPVAYELVDVADPESRILFPLERSPYTKDAYGEFLEAHGIPADLMLDGDDDPLTHLAYEALRQRAAHGVTVTNLLADVADYNGETQQ